MQMRVLAATIVALMLTPVGFAQSAANAGEQLNALRKQARAAIDAKDNALALKLVLELQASVHDAPNGLRTSARSYVAAGDNTGALRVLDQLAAMGLVDDAFADETDPRFAPLKALAAYGGVRKRMAVNRAEVQHAEEVFDVADAGLLPEDIDYDAATKSFLVTSVLEKKIVRVGFDGRMKEFAASPSGWPMMALRVDAKRHVVWATEVAVDGFAVVAKKDWGRSAVVCFDARSGKLLSRVESPQTALGDMTLAANGDPIVSDGEGGGVYRLHAGKPTRVDSGEFVSPQTPVLLPDGEHVLVPDYVRGMAVLDLKTHKAKWMDTRRYAMAGVDGAVLSGRSLLVTQNGVTPERVMRFRMDGTLTRVVREDVVERSTATLGEPTHGVVVGGWFYYIANAGWSALDDHGGLKPGQTMTRAHVMRFKLGRG